MIPSPPTPLSQQLFNDVVHSFNTTQSSSLKAPCVNIFFISQNICDFYCSSYEGSIVGLRYTIDASLLCAVSIILALDSLSLKQSVYGMLQYYVRYHGSVYFWLCVARADVVVSSSTTIWCHQVLGGITQFHQMIDGKHWKPQSTQW